jgi:hypothetical protein
VNHITSPPGRREAIAAIMGSEEMAQLDAAWTAFAARPELCVTVYGPYDSGKTTLVKRLLIEGSTPVPGWLTISGRPETAKVTETESEGIIYVDTPGTAGRSEEHNRLAEEALTLTDALMAVLPQQRVREDTGRVAELAAGYPQGVLLVVIAQSDTVGADPQSDLDEFRRLCGHRRAELLKVLPEELARVLSDAVHVVAADPYGEVGSLRQPDLGHYDSYRAWDGIAGLRASLLSLSRRLPELRDAAQRRYWDRAAALARAQGERELHELDAVVAEAEQRRQRQAILERELTTINEAAAGELRQAIGDELNTMLWRASGMDMEAIRSATEESLQRRVRAWQLEYGRKLETLIQQADMELALQGVEPSSVKYDQWLHKLVMPQRQEAASGPLAERVQAFSDPAAKAFEGAIRLHLGVPIDEARQQLKSVDELKDWAGRRYRWQVSNLDPNVGDLQGQRAALQEESAQVVDDFLVSGSVIKNLKDAEHVRTWISRMDVAIEFVPAVMAMGGLIAEQIRDRQAALKEVQERKRVSRAADAFTEEILGDSDNPAEGTWRHAVNAIQARLRADALLEPVTVAAKERMEIITSACKAL